MRIFTKWLEAVAVQNQRQLSTGNGGNFWDQGNNDGGGGDDDDFENGPWGWKKMQSLNLALHDWAKKSPAMLQIGQLITQTLFHQPPFKENVRVFPAHVQVEVEWELKIDEWSELDNQIEGVLKGSDLHKPLGITQDKLWDTVDRGAVYDYMMYVIIISLTGRQLTGGQASYMDNQASFYTWQYLRENWPEKEAVIKQHIQDFHDENRLGQVQVQLDTSTRSFNKPVGISQATNGASNLWAKGIASIPYHVLNQRDENPENPEVWDSWGDDRPMNYRLGYQRPLR